MDEWISVRSTVSMGSNASAVRGGQEEYHHPAEVSGQTLREDQDVQEATRGARVHLQLQHHEGQEVPEGPRGGREPCARRREHT